MILSYLLRWLMTIESGDTVRIADGLHCTQGKGRGIGTQYSMIRASMRQDARQTPPGGRFPPGGMVIYDRSPFLPDKK